MATTPIARATGFLTSFGMTIAASLRNPAFGYDGLVPYHEGEIAVQTHAGVAGAAARVGRIIGSAIPAQAAQFVAAQPMIIVSTVSGSGEVRCSLLGGQPGFARAEDPTSLTVQPVFGHIDRVMADVKATGSLGLLAIEPATRRRIRVNGTATWDNGVLRVETREVYSNCPQYIQPRTPESTGPTGNAEIFPSVSLTGAQQAWISGSDTFFIASTHPAAGSDASHRGGPPGFVQVTATHLSFADFPGNNMFNTLGNLETNPRCGLLFVDFEKGATLQISARASIRWKDSANRTVEFQVESVVETRGAVPLRWRQDT